MRSRCEAELFLFNYYFSNNSTTRHQLSLTSCIDKIPEVAKTKVSTKEIFFIKVKILPHPPKTCLRHGVGRFS